MSSTTQQSENTDDGADELAEEEVARPRVEGSPDELAVSVTGWQEHIRAIICETPEFASSPFCGRDPP